MKHTIVIGAGIGGLATAALLGKKGYQVTVLEKNADLGGRARVWKSKGFTFDMGPSWYLMPDVFERYFALFDKKPSDFFQLKRLDPNYRIFFSDHEHLDIAAELDKNLKLFEKIEPGFSARFKEYLQQSKYQYEVAMSEFIYKQYTSVFDFFNKRMLTEGRKMKVYESLDKYISRFTQSDKIKKILEYSIVFLGGSPKNVPAFYSLMSHIDFNMGVFYPEGGISKTIEAFEKLCKDHHVKILPNQEVTQIEVSEAKAHTVKTKKASYQADLVISNADYPFTETQLLDSKWQTYPEKYWKKRTLAPSAFILYLGIKGRVKNLSHHNLFFANDWMKHFDEIFDQPALPNKPSYYVCCPSVTDPTVAPEGCENLFILVPVASGLEDSEDTRQVYADKIINHFEGLIHEKLQNRIVVQRIFSQRDFAEDYNAYQGTALGLAHTLMQTAIFRPANKSKKVKNLYYVGQYTQPGIGMPMCLISAQLTAERIEMSK